MTLSRLPLALMLAAAPLPAFAQTAETPMADMKCMMAAGSIDPASPKEQQDAMMLMAVFYVGKVYGRNPAFDVTPAGLLTGIICESGVLVPDALASLAVS